MGAEEMDKNRDLLFLQTRLLRLASLRWGISLRECADIFQKYSVFDYIKDLYGIFHVQGDEADLLDVTEYIKIKGANVSC